MFLLSAFLLWAQKKRHLKTDAAGKLTAKRSSLA